MSYLVQIEYPNEPTTVAIFKSKSAAQSAYREAKKYVGIRSRRVALMTNSINPHVFESIAVIEAA